MKVYKLYYPQKKPLHSLTKFKATTTKKKKTQKRGLKKKKQEKRKRKKKLLRKVNETFKWGFFPTAKERNANGFIEDFFFVEVLVWSSFSFIYHKPG